MLSALIPPVGRKPAVPLAGQLAHESYVRPGPLVLGTAFLKSPTAASDRDRTVSRMFIPHYCGHRLYLHPLSRGWRVMASTGVCGPRFRSKEAISSLLLAKKSLRGHNTPMLRRCCSTSTAEIRFVSEQFRICECTINQCIHCVG